LQELRGNVFALVQVDVRQPGPITPVTQLSDEERYWFEYFARDDSLCFIRILRVSPLVSPSKAMHDLARHHPSGTAFPLNLDYVAWLFFPADA